MKGRPVQKTRGAALLAATALVMSGLAACGDEGGTGEASSTASPSAAGSGSSETSGSSDGSSSGSEDTSSSAGGDGEVAELPEAATKKTKAGAIAFNEFYFVESGKALTTGHTEHLKRYGPSCVPCDDFLKSVEDATKNGTRMNTNPTSISESSARERSDGGYRVELDIKESEYHELLPDGSKGRTAEATSLTIVTDTQWADDGWVIKDQVRTQ